MVIHFKVGWRGRCLEYTTASLQRGKTSPTSVLWPSKLRLYNTPTLYLQRDKTSPMSVLWQFGWGCRIHRLYHGRGVRLPQRVSYSPVGLSLEYTDSITAEELDCSNECPIAQSAVGRIHRLHLSRGVRLPQWVSCGQFGWGCRIHRLYHGRGVRLPQRVSYSLVGLSLEYTDSITAEESDCLQRVSYCPVGCGCRIHRLHLSRGVRLPQWVSCGQFGWGCRIHRLYHGRGVRLPQRVSYSLALSLVGLSLEYTDSITAEESDSSNECPIAQSAVAVEYTDCILAEG